MPESFEIVRLQSFREQYRVTIPVEMIGKLRWQKGQSLFVSVDESKLIIEPVTKK